MDTIDTTPNINNQLLREINHKIDQLQADSTANQIVNQADLDVALVRLLDLHPKFNDILARLAHLEAISPNRLDNIRLGKKPARYDSRTLRLEKYFLPDLPPPASSCDWTGGITSWGMMLNNQLGDCTIAACGHAVQSWTKLASGNELTLTDKIILAYYESWAGYNPNDPATDEGANELDVLNKWRKFGFGRRVNKVGVDKLFAYADTDPSNVEHVKQAISLFGGVYIGIQLPITAQNQSTWSVVGDGQTGNSAPGSWGGHAVWCPKYTPNYITCATWGGLTNMTLDFWKAYCDESHVLLSPDFIDKYGLSPSHFDLTALENDLFAVTE